MADLFETLRDALVEHYAVQRELGRGGMATVFLAEDLKHHRPVAIKVLHSELAAALGSDRFLREIAIAARLQHPHILPLYDSGTVNRLLYYVMPYVEGESLRDRLEREKQLSVDEAVRITTEVASALAYAHSHSVVHRDIKPENILLEGGTAIVADFGIARAISVAEEERHLTQTGTVVGTPIYMSPEQATGSVEIDGRSDQYSLACVTYEMLVGAPPFSGPTAQAIMARHSLDMVSPPSIVRTTIPDAVEDAILRALAKTPADRFPTTALFAEALQKPSAATGPMRRMTRPVPAPRRWLGMRSGVTLGVVGAVMVAAAWGSRSVWSRSARPAAGSAGGLDPRRIAVLYFDDLSRDSSLAYLADGLTETLIDELGPVKPLEVISRNGAARYRHASVSRDSIARALKVGSLVEGSVEEVGDRVRVTVRLVDGSSGADIDRQTFEQPKGNLLRIRDTLTQQVASALRGRLGEEIRLREQKGGTENVTAWVLLQQAERARKLADSLAKSDMVAATREFGHADSLSAVAEAADLAWGEPTVLRGFIAYRQSRLAGDAPEANRRIDTGLGHVERALGVNPKNARALELRGSLRYWRWLLHLVPDPREAADLLNSAEQDLRSAVALDASLAGAWSALSHLDNVKSDEVQGKIDALRAYEADAYYSSADLIVWRLFLASYDLEQFVDAVHWCDVGQQRFPKDPRFVECQLWLMTSQAEAPDVAKAWQLVDQLGELTPAQRWEFGKLKAQMAVAAVLARDRSVDSARR
ncbi:MAG TPA: serine/threonine-protein kinase, partial [Gemmatimonadales bacterium]|nr:serine/threonine-protein kinase [Gemmatimonadales bacterium]